MLPALTLGYWRYNEYLAAYPAHLSLREDSGTLHIKYHAFHGQKSPEFREVWIDSDRAEKLSLNCREKKPCEIYDVLDQIEGHRGMVSWRHEPGTLKSEVKVFGLSLEGKEIIHYDSRIPSNPDIWGARVLSGVMLFVVAQIYLVLRKKPIWKKLRART